jgi:7-carboxy-7-deazaguanine synthase
MSWRDMHTLNIENTLKITEIFHSLQGESSTVGWPTVFVRLTGCPLRCSYCDTAYAFHGGKRQPIDDIVSVVDGYQARYVTVTGGEPLAQPGCFPLLKKLCDADYRVSLETAGALDITAVDPRVKIIMDLKTPDSGEESANRYENIALLKPSDEVKFVIGSKTDYDWSVAQCKKHDLASRFDVLFSPSYGILEAQELANWVVRDRLLVRVQVQLHKILWGDKEGV